MKKILFVFVGILIIQTISAITCNPSYVTTSYNQSESKQVSISCTNQANQTITLTKTGDFTLSQDSILPLSIQTITLTFNPASAIGYNTGSLTFSDSTVIPIFYSVLTNQQTISSACSIDIFPTVLTNIKIQQGETKIRNIQLSVPSCHSPVNVNGVALQTEEKPIQLDELSLGTIQPGRSILIPININAVGVATGQYSDTLQILLYDTNGSKINVPSVSISVLVSQGIQPTSNFSFNELPTCSLDAITLNLNNTYKLTCSISNPNFEIKPIIDNKYIKGMSVSETSSQYIYEFKAVFLGETMINAEFIYKNAPIGTPFSQEVRITPSGNSPVPGTDLKIIFFPSLDSMQDGQETIIQLVDNKTDSLVDSPEIYINAIPLIPMNSSAKSFPFKMNVGTNYELRAVAPGYNNLIMTANISSKSIDYTIIPSKDKYITGDYITINSSIENFSIFVNGVSTSSSFYITKEGQTEIKLMKTGFLSTVKNITVESAVSLKNCIPNDKTLWKKGKDISCQLTKNVSWSVYNDAVLKNSGTGDFLNFTIDKKGVWEIKAEDKFLDSINLQSKSILDFFKGKFIFMAVWLWFLIFGGIIGLIVVLRRKGHSSEIPVYS